MRIVLSKAIIKDAGRAQGVVLMVPFPPDLPSPGQMEEGELTNAQPHEIAAATEIVRDHLPDELIMRHVEVAFLKRQNAEGMQWRGAIMFHLACYVMGGRFYKPGTRCPDFLHLTWRFPRVEF
jgi:hypothetical protein